METAVMIQFVPGAERKWVMNNAEADNRHPKEDLLNGAKNWSQYSRDGNYLIYDSDICKALCGPREQKRTKTGTLPPNDREDWMDMQARALQQAAAILMDEVNRRTK